MRKFLLSVVALGFIAGPAVAADIPVKAAPRAVADVWSWTGLYLGASGGWHRQDMDWAFNPALAAAANQSFSLKQDSWLVGAHVGVQWQFNQFVLGVESAGSWLSDKEARHIGYGVGAAFAVASVDQLFTFGGRLGWSPWPANNWLFYVTGGYANAMIQTKNVSFAGVENGAFRTDRRHNGWYVGAGIEYQIWRNWIVGVEYQHVDLETRNHCPTFACPDPTNTNRHDMSATIDIVRARLSWKFDWAAPVVARY
jgi:outer membrane immunogenic protein